MIGRYLRRIRSGAHTAIKKIRLALGDSADNLRFVETVPRKGYRFIAPVNGNPFSTTAAPTAQRRGRRLVWAAALFGLVISLGLGVWLLQKKQMSKPSPVPVPLTSYPGDEVSPSFSPDGNYVAFGWSDSDKFCQGNFDIFIKTINGGDPIRITHDPASDVSPAWSPDGRFIAFLRALSNGVSGVFLIPAIGGPERKLTEIHGVGESCYEAFLSWFPDSKALAVLDRESPDAPTAVFRLSLESGEKQRLTSPPRASWGDWDPAVSPDGSAVVFRRSLSDTTNDLFLLELSGSSGTATEAKRLTFENNAGEPAWTPDGRAIIFSAGPAHALSLWELTLSRSGRRPGNLERLAYAGNGTVTPAISRQGRLAYAQGSLDVDIWELNLNGQRPAPQPPIRLISSTRVDHEARYSPDGKRIAFASNRSGSLEIWVCNRDGSANTQLTSFGGFYYTASPRWSPDGRLIAFASTARGEKSAYVISADGGKPQGLPIDDLWNWSRDGKWVYFGSGRSGNEQLWKMPWPLARQTGAAVQVTKKGCGGEAVESLDGKFVYYLKGASEENYSLWRVPTTGGEETQVIGSVFHNNFTVADRGIYFIPSAQPLLVQFLSFDDGAIETIAKIPREPAWGFSLSPDGRSLLFSEFEQVRSDLMLVENLQ